jgi:hypothetical protein
MTITGQKEFQRKIKQHVKNYLALRHILGGKGDLIVENRNYLFEHRYESLPDKILHYD